MHKKMLLALGLAFWAATGPAARAADVAWVASAAPVTQDQGTPHCHMTGGDGVRMISFIAQPGKQFIGVYAPALENREMDLQTTLRFAGGTTYQLKWLGANGSYIAQLSRAGLSTLLDAVMLWDDEMHLEASGGTTVRFALDGAADTARAMFDCRKKLPEG